MSDVAIIVNKLNAQIEQIIGLHQKAVLEIENLKEKNTILKGTVLEKNQEIVNLNERIKVIKLAKTIEETGEDTSKLKLKINEVIREVDKCIAMLNK